MSKCIILYHSHHHNNTEKVVREIAKAYPDILLINLSASEEQPETRINADECDVIGLASGIYMGKPHPDIVKFVQEHQKFFHGKRVFTILTSGSGGKKYGKSFHAFLEEQGCSVLGDFQCKGFDTYGPFRFIGGMAKGHPNQKELAEAAAFVGRIYQ